MDIKIGSGQMLLVNGKVLSKPLPNAFGAVMSMAHRLIHDTLQTGRMDNVLLAYLGPTNRVLVAGYRVNPSPEILQSVSRNDLLPSAQELWTIVANQGFEPGLVLMWGGRMSDGLYLIAWRS